MPRGSHYLPWSEWLGPAFLASAGGFAWLALFIDATWLDLACLLAVSLLAGALAGGGTRGRPPAFKVAAAAVPVIALAAVIYGMWMQGSARAAIQARGAAAFAVSLAPVLWSAGNDILSRRQMRALWTALATAVPVLYARWLYGSGMPAWMVAAPGSFLLAGSATYLWSQEGSDRRYFARVTGAAAAGAVVICLLAPGIARAAARLASLALKGAGAALYLVVKPIGYLVGYVIDVLARMIAAAARKPIESEPSQFLLGELEKQLGEYVTPAYMVVVGRVLACAAVCVVAWLVWRAVRSSGRRRAPRQSQADITERSPGDALSWAASKARDLASAAASLARSLLPGRAGDRDALVDLYARFLEVAERSGTTRNPGDTPLEFASTIALALPAAGAPIHRISREFSRFFYSGRRPGQEDMGLLEQDLRAVAAAAKDDAKRHAGKPAAGRQETSA